MIVREKRPDLFIYNKSRTKNLGLVTGIIRDCNYQYNYNSASQLNFSIQKYLYDEINGKWIKNPCYDNIEKYAVIASTDTGNKYHFRGCELKSSYDIKPSANQPYHVSYHRTSKYTPTFYNATLQHETLLFDIGSDEGRVWRSGGYLANGDGSIEYSSSSDLDRQADKALDDFIPVQFGDIIALGSKTYTQSYRTNPTEYYRRWYENDTTSVDPNSGYDHATIFSNSSRTNPDSWFANWFNYRICFYSQPNAASYVTYYDIAASPVWRYRVGKDKAYQTPSSSTVINQHDGIFGGNKSGYVRIMAINTMDVSNAWKVYTPDHGFIRIYSGERRCFSFECQTATEHYLPEQWWVVTDTTENDEGYNSYKEVTLYGYEYVLSFRGFSTSEKTLPLFIPDEMTNAVTGANMIVDACDDYTVSGHTPSYYYMPQRMERGLINQILDYMPNWSVGYISDGIGTKYRSIGAVDNENIYSYLVNTVQSTYQCFIFFDTENYKLNLISFNDAIGYNDYLNTHFPAQSVLTWQNAIKSIGIQDKDTEYLTAMRVHSEEDTYSVGLVNPNGSNVVYNFDSIKDELDYVVDDQHTHTVNGSPVPYTLKEVIEKYKQDLSNVLSNTSTTGFQYITNHYIADIKESVELESKMSLALTDYKTVVDKIKMYVQLDAKIGGAAYPPNTAYLSPDFPLTVADISSGGSYAPSTTTYDPNNSYANYHSAEVYSEFRGIVEAFWGAKQTYTECLNRINGTGGTLGYKQRLANWATYFSLNYHTVIQAQADGVSTCFTPAELLVLCNYIYEGDWRDNNATFSEEYSADDIVITLKDLYNNATKDLQDIYGRRNYTFELQLSNIFADKEMLENVSHIYLGNCINIVTHTDGWIQPYLLGVHYSYSASDFGFSLTLSTNYKNKTLELRFSELFGTISQTTPSKSEISYDV